MDNSSIPDNHDNVSFTECLRLLNPLQSVIEQMAAAPSGEASTAQDISALPRVTIKGKEYIHASLLSTKFSCRSHIFNHGFAVLGYINQQMYWACSECDKQHTSILYKVAATSTASMHLERKHHIYNLKQSYNECGDDSKCSTLNLSTPDLSRAAASSTGQLNVAEMFLASATRKKAKQ
jgi:hypothetical protein